jgi:hypothetical protein
LKRIAVVRKNLSIGNLQRLISPRDTAPKENSRKDREKTVVSSGFEKIKK